MQRNFILFFYGLLLDNFLPFEDETVTNLLMPEAPNHILIHLSGGSDIVTSTSFNKTRACFRRQILKVYNILLVTLFTKCTQSFKFSKNCKSDYSLQTLSILRACKMKHDDSQTLACYNSG